MIGSLNPPGTLHHVSEFRYHSIMIYEENVYVVMQMTKINFSFIFGLPSRFPAHSSPNPWNFPKCWECGKSVLCWTNEVSFGNDGDSVRLKPFMWSEGCSLQSCPTTNPWGRERGWRLSSFANHQWSDQVCPCNAASVNNGKGRVQRASGSVGTWRFAQNGTLRTLWVWRSPALAPCLSSIWQLLSSSLLH